MRAVEAALASTGRPVRMLESRELPEVDGLAVDVELDWTDHRGAPRTARAHLWFSGAVLDGSDPASLRFFAGYETVDEMVAPLLAERVVVANPGAPASPDEPDWNPLSRGPNFDFALLHLARALPFVDVNRVAIAGGSAGGYMALMCAAETFPLAALTADVPVTNLGYAGAYLRHNSEVALAAWGGTTPGLPGLAAVLGLKEPIERVYGGELDAEIYFRHSPVAVAALITAPASIVSSTADMMVPLDQVSREHVRRPAAGVMPPGYSSAPEDLSESRHVSTTLADALQGADVRFEVVPVPEGVPRLSPEIQPGDYVAVPIPWTDAQWTVAVVDEGAPDPGTGHVKYAIRIPRDPAVLERLLARPSASQLTAAKLRQLLQRLDGQEWLYPGVRHLDDPDAERADVQKGLAAFRSLPGGEERFREVLPAVDPDLRALAESELPLAAGA